MPMFFTRTTNADFDIRDEGAQHDHPQAALKVGIFSAVGLAADEIQRGVHSAAIIVTIEEEDGTPVIRSVVSVAVAPLLSIGEEANPMQIAVK